MEGVISIGSMHKSRDPLIVGGIVGDVVDYFDASARLRVLYGNREIMAGSELRPSQVANQPTVHITGRAGSLYTLTLMCLDQATLANGSTSIVQSKSLIQFNSSVHRLVTDIPEGGDVGHGTEVVAYERPQPTAGIHRLAFVVFRQMAREAIYPPGWRSNFVTRDMAECYSLGALVAAAYINCQREGSCGGQRWQG
uniref:Protein FLOWERING LOCUS T n=1 Tax=Aegilops tauschii TaxID=37682 RepID=N1QYD7_AEGTA